MTKKKDEIVPGSNAWISPSMPERDKETIRSDPGTVLADSRGQFLEIYHIPSGQSIKFKAYIDDFQDKYDSEWTSAPVYGRMDPIYQFQGTTRVISLDWHVPSISTAESKLNHQKCALLFSMLYPNYDDTPIGGRSSATQISTSPLFKVKFGNLIQNPTNGNGDVTESGLVGAIEGFTYAPDLDLGFIDDIGGFATGVDAYPGGYGNLYPKSVKLSMEFKVLHTHGLGWEGTKKRNPQFPYGDTPEQEELLPNPEGMDEHNASGEAAVLLDL